MLHMMKVTSKEKYNTTFGKAYILNGDHDIKVGQTIIIDNEQHKIKRILLPSRPNENNDLTVFV